MKRHLVLEYHIRKLEKVILEDIDSDLDKMSDDTLNRMPNDNLDVELEVVTYADYDECGNGTIENIRLQGEYDPGDEDEIGNSVVIDFIWDGEF